ncbi:MAG TPA: hypothetical protein VHE83_17245, partial [Mycobacteriales bacterium]|nr:hypothetical protein [Mycobacteriales bacterium]
MAGSGRIGAVAVMTGCCLFATAPASLADSPTVVGWWTSLNVGNPLPVGPPAISLASEPDVPPGGLLVQGGASASQPIAFGAISYFVPDGASVTRLDLTLAVPLSIPTTAVHACALQIATFPADAGGPTSQAPPYDCSRSVEGALSADSTRFSFAVGPLVKDGVLSVAILPDGISDRVVFAKPGDASVVTTHGGAAATPTTARPSPSARATAGPATVPTEPAPVNPGPPEDAVALPGL